MAEPARRSPAGHDAPGWGDVRREMIAAARFAASAVAAYLAAGGDDEGPGAAMAREAIALFEAAGETARHGVAGEAEIAAARAVAGGRQARPGPRRRGHLRALS